MPGDATTPLPRKLGIKPGATVALIDAPAGWALADLPDGVVVRHRAAGPADVIVAFCDRRAKVRQRLPAALKALTGDGSLWIAWPRRAAGHPSDITDNELRAIVLPSGLVDTKVAALDDDWSGLKFVWRKRLRPSAARPSRQRDQADGRVATT